MASGPSRKDIVDPRPALEAEYRAEVDRLRSEFDGTRGLAARWRWWRLRRRLYRERVIKPLRAARW